MSILFAATYPDRTRALVLCGAEVKEETTDDWPWGEATRAEFEEYCTIEQVLSRWGKGLIADYVAPSRVGDERLREWYGRLQLQSQSPHDAVAFMRMAFEIDVRDVVPSVNVPTLILHRTDDPVCHVGNARWLAQHIAGSRYVELAGIDHLPWIDGDDMLDEIQEFLTGVREPVAPDRVLATVLFTDIVGSTDRARELGDRRWRDLVDEHHSFVRRQLERFRGREVDTAGDGFFATFDGPARAIRCAKSVVDGVPTLGLQVRAGVHTGEVELAGDSVRGIAVHTGARVASLAGPGEVLVSGTVKDLIAGSGIELTDRGVHPLKGSPASGTSTPPCDDEFRNRFVTHLVRCLAPELAHWRHAFRAQTRGNCVARPRARHTFGTVPGTGRPFGTRPKSVSSRDGIASTAASATSTTSRARTSHDAVVSKSVASFQ
jgi:class 3 adenylate cyclase